MTTTYEIELRDDESVDRIMKDRRVLAYDLLTLDFALHLIEGDARRGNGEFITRIINSDGTIETLH